MVADTVLDFRGLAETLLSVSAPGQDLRGATLNNPLMSFDTFVRFEPAYWVLGYWCAVPLLRYFGRRGAIYATVGLRLAGLLYAMISPKLSSNGVSGALYAITKGMFLCIMPMYFAETSPIPARGSILLTWKLFVFPCMLIKKRNLSGNGPVNSLDVYLGLKALGRLLGFGFSYWLPQLLYPCRQHSCF